MPRTRRKNIQPQPPTTSGIQCRSLSNPADHIALRGVRLRCQVVGLTARTTLEQTFVNLEPRAIEAVYTLPLPESAAVCCFEVVFFDKIFTGVVEESDKAIDQYEDAIEQGHGAYLLEQNRPDVFTVRVGNLKPRQAVTIRLTYVQDLEIVDRSIRLAFPTTIAPRYVSSAGTDPIDAMIDGHALNPPHVLSVPYGLSMEVNLNLGNALTRVSSPSHPITVHHAGVGASSDDPDLRRATTSVTLATGMTEMNRDVVLELELAKEQEPFALATTNDQGERFLAVTFVPQFQDEDFEGVSTGTETVFVLDCSGSMMGDSIEQATAALECCLRSMSAGDTFNVCRFGSDYEMFSGEPLEYSQFTLDAALAFVRRTDDLGGTELYHALNFIMFQTPARGAARNIVLLTDGQVSNEPAVIDLARRHKSRNRIFTFGIGTACSAYLVNGLARVTGGAAEFITPGERIEDKVLRTFGRIASPPVTDVELELHNADAEIAPKETPAIFEGDAVRLFARLPGRTPDTITLRCRTPAGPRAWTIPVHETLENQDTLPTFWARAMIRSLEDQRGLTASAVSSSADPHHHRLLELSKRYNLLCSLTSFIALEHRSLEDRNQGQPATRRIPLLLAQGWHGVDAAPAAGAGIVAFSAAAPADFDDICLEAEPRFAIRKSIDKSADPAATKPRSRAARAAGGARFLTRLFHASADSAAPSSQPPAPPTGDPLIQLLAHQSADGGFEESPLVWRVLKSTPVDYAAVTKVIDHFLRERHTPSDHRSKIAFTLCVLFTLRLAFPDRHPSWSRAARKTLRYLAGELNAKASEIEQWLTDTRDLV